MSGGGLLFVVSECFPQFERISMNISRKRGLRDAERSFGLPFLVGIGPCIKTMLVDVGICAPHTLVVGQTIGIPER